MKTYVVLCLADIHVGSKLAVLHPDTQGYALHNEAQEYLWECWKHMLDNIPKTIDALVLMDECMDGPSRPNNKYGTLITTPFGQRQAAKKLLEPVIWRTTESGKKVKRCKQVWSLIGSAWHIGEWGEHTLMLAEELGSEKWKSEKRAGHNLLLRYGNIVLDFAHHSSYTMVNRSMPLEREIRYRAIDNPLPKDMQLEAEIKLIVRAHTHTFGQWEDRHMKALSCPGWMFPFYQYGVAKKSMARIQPDIGWALMRIKPDAKPPIAIHVERYDLPGTDVYDVEVGKWWGSVE